MRKMFLMVVILSLLNGGDSNSTKSNISKRDEILKQELKKQMEREKKYAREQTFYQGDEYNLSASEVNQKSLSSIQAIEPDYDFNMDDAYSDEQ